MRVISCAVNRNDKWQNFDNCIENKKLRHDDFCKKKNYPLSSVRWKYYIFFPFFVKQYFKGFWEIVRSRVKWKRNAHKIHKINDINSKIELEIEIKIIYIENIINHDDIQELDFKLCWLRYC